MEIIAWDKETNTAIEPNRLPTDGEYACFKTDTHTVFKHFYVTVEPVDNTIPIVVTGVTGTIANNSLFTDITCYELTDIIVSGEIDAPDQFFRMPVIRNDGKDTIFLVELVGGKFNAVLNFPTSGVYHYTNIQANARFLEPLFNIEPISITVVRKVGV